MEKFWKKEQNINYSKTEEVMECKKEMLQLYAVTDRAWEVKGNFLEQIEEALKGGITCLQLREKEMKENEFLEEALKVKKICEKYNTPLIINDNVIIFTSNGEFFKVFFDKKNGEIKLI